MKNTKAVNNGVVKLATPQQHQHLHAHHPELTAVMRAVQVFFEKHEVCTGIVSLMAYNEANEVSESTRILYGDRVLVELDLEQLKREMPRFVAEGSVWGE